MSTRRNGFAAYRRTPSIGGGFKPTFVSGCVLWLRADMGVQIATGVSRWHDQSGNGVNFSQITGTAQPTYSANGGPNGQACLVFNPAASQCLTLNSVLTPVSAMTQFIVLKAGTLGGTQYAFSIGTTSNGITLGISTSSRVIAVQAVAFDTDTTNNGTTNWEQWTETSSAAPLHTLRVNGVAHTVSPNNSAPVAATTQSQIGNAGSNAGSFWGGGSTGSIAEIIVYSSVLSAANISQIEAYLLARYGV